MGLLSLGTPLAWEDASKHSQHVKSHGISQFLSIWNRLKKRTRDTLLWGDEVEYMVIHVDKQTKSVTLSLKAHDTLIKLENLQKESASSGNPLESSWHPEYGTYMLEGTPALPYGGKLVNLLDVEANMKERRRLAQSMLGPNDFIVSMTAFPFLGKPHCFTPDIDPTPLNGASMSLFIPDSAINPHARFPTLTANIRKRRQSKVSINIPIFKDTNTQVPFFEPLPNNLKNLSLEQLNEIKKWSNSGLVDKNISQNHEFLCDVIPDARPDHVYLDAMCFGMGCSCLQITFQACSIEEARKLYDQLAPMTPIMLALSAAAPIMRGYLTDRDCRWNVISGSVDDRTKEERGLFNPDSPPPIMKSRYDSISTYLSPGPIYTDGGCCGGTTIETNSNGQSEEKLNGDFYKSKYNDLDISINQQVFETLKQNDVDDLLARHYAHLFIRDPLVIFKELLDQDDESTSDHFENIQSTNWQTMRFKPPPPASTIGWRVEFRSMEVQMTDFENAAFSVFIVLLTRTILSLGLNLYIPLSRVDENMQTAQQRNAVLDNVFYFRNHLNDPTLDDSYSLMKINTIMNGSNEFIGLIPLIKTYLHKTHCDTQLYDQFCLYLDEIGNRASGKKSTNAKTIRDFVHKHPVYRHDSIIHDEILFDMLPLFCQSN